ncbi:MAG: hypothetical protein LBN05_02955 [Oscillospiraceae bacterium]|jgi:uncharacterized membrane protein YdjX (TVP38/TMEM64 family)|nr:hypothetical protein [Oscillospiraceae bacterium]
MQKRRLGRRLWEFLGVLCVLGGAAAFVLLLLLRADERFPWYTTAREVLTGAETFLRSLRPKPLFALAIMLCYLLCAKVPIFALSTLCLVSAAVLPTPWALLLNTAGVSLLCTLKYRQGDKKGGGRAWDIVLRNRGLRTLLEREGAGNPWVLAALRLTPICPVGGVSRLYGAMEYPRGGFLWVTLAGLAPRMVAYTFLGRGVFDPLSTAFLSPLILVLLISGFTLLFWDTLLRFASGKKSREASYSLQEFHEIQKKRKTKL